MKNVSRWLLVPTLLAIVAASPAAAQPQPPAEHELREALFRYFETMLRADLALSDEQADALMPMVRALEQQRGAAQRERAQVTRELRRGYRSGASDEELGELLRRLEEIEQRSQQQTREGMLEIDRQLSVRQQVQFRATVQRFRAEVQRRIRELRGGAGRPRPRRAPRAPATSPPAPPPPQR